MRSSIVILLLISMRSFAFISTGDVALVQIASNTLSQLRDLKEIITETREFNEQFEAIHSRVETAIWKADRFTMWMEDIKRMQESEIENLDDFNAALWQIKSSKIELERMWKEEVRQKKEGERLKSKIKKENTRDKNARLRYASGAKSSLSPSQAQVDTAKTNREQLIETNITNERLNRLTGLVEKMNTRESEKNKELLKERARAREQNNQLARGVLKEHYTKVKR